MWILAILILFVVLGCGVIAAICVGYATGHLVFAIAGVIVLVIAAGVVWSLMSKEVC